jgi:hypothetical protein
MPYSSPASATLFASAARVAAVTNSAGTAVVLPWQRAVLLLDVTASGGVAGDVLDVYVDVLGPGGTTWLNAAHFTQIAGDSAAIKHYAELGPCAPAATSFNVTADCAAGVTKPYLWGPSIRGRYTLVKSGAGEPSVTFSLKAILV